MLSVGSRGDARKGLGLGGLHGASEEMEENELEEGEACSIREDDANINPDVDLSYIDEKIQDILGHFQKDFEGGVSAENLGAKFGGYGSFLPAYQRSPSIWPHPRSPQRVPNHNASCSPCNAPAEAAVGTSASVPLKNSTVLKVPPMDGTKKNGTCISIPTLREPTPHYDSANTGSRSNDQNVLKLRIKVGPDNALPRPNAAIYSDMGLEYSPSLSPEDSPGTSGGSSPESRDTTDESPMTIFQIMTCFPILDGYVLSPLPDSLLQMMENERPCLRDSKLTIHKSGLETRDVLLCDSSSSRDVKPSLGKKAKSAERNVKSSDTKSMEGKSGANVASGIRKKEVDVDAPGAREPVSNAPGIQIQQSLKATDNRSEKQQFPEAARDDCISRDPNNVLSKTRDVSPDLAKDELLLPVVSLDTRKDSNAGNGFHLSKGKLNFRAASSDTAVEDGKSIRSTYGSLDPHMELGAKSDKTCDAFKPEIDGSNSRKDMVVESQGPFEAKGPQEPTLPGQTGERLFQPKDQSPGAKEKSGNQMTAIPPMELPKDSSKSVFSVTSKEKKKSSQSKIVRSENKRNSMGPDKESNGILFQERHKEGVGDAKPEHMGKRTDPMESTFTDKTRDSKIEHEKSTFSSSEKTKERADGKKVQNLQLPDAFGRSTEVAPLMANGLTSDVASAPPSHVVIEEHWVCCDRCQKWRLLPYGTDPDHLPKKWLCTMLTWLAGMNKCSVSEEVTTGALRALYQVPPPENHASNIPNISIAVLPDGQHLNQNQEPGLDTNSSHGKKKHTQKDASHVPSHLTHPSHSAKKSHQASVKSRSLDDVNQVAPHSSSKSSFQHVSKANELNVKKDNDRQKEKHKMEEQNLDGGEFLEQNGKCLKSKNKRDFAQDGFRASKKVKADGILGADEDWLSDHDLSGKVVSINNNGLPPKMTNKSSVKGDANSSFKNSKSNSQDSLPGSRKKLKPQTLAMSNGYSTFDEENFDKESAAKKRKVKERQVGHVDPDAIIGNGLLTDDRSNVKEEVSESESRKEKRSRVLKAEGRYSIVNKVDEKIDKKGRVTKVLISTSREHILDRMEEDKKNAVDDEQKGLFKGSIISERNVDSLDSLKRDFPYVNPPTAATSSSSKVSGTCKSKSNFQEARGSPVESVSSSPLRISNADKLVNKKNQVRKDEDNDYAVAHGGLLDSSQPVDSRVRDPAKALPEYQAGEEAQILVGEGRDGRRLKAFSNMHDDLPPMLEGNHLVSDGVTPAQHSKYHDDFHDRNHGHNEEKLHNLPNSSDFAQRKSSKSSLQPREKHKSLKSDVNKGKAKISDSFSEREDMRSTKKSNGSRYDTVMDAHQLSTSHEDAKDICNRTEKKDAKRRESAGRQSTEGRRDNHSGFGTQENMEAYHLLPKQHKDKRSKDSEIKTMAGNGGKSYNEDNPQTGACEGDAKLPNCFPVGRTEKSEFAHGRGKSQLHSHSGDKQELPNRGHPRAILSVAKGDRSEASSADPVTNEASKVLKQPGKLDSQNGQHHSSMRHPTPNGPDAPSPARRDSSHSAATVALKEARDLKHSANRLKNEGLEHESTGLYFQAALKFLHVAFLLENSGAESGKHGETTQSMAMYSDTARLCEFCAHEYERHKEMAAAALAYKCMEVAYMKVVFLKHACANKDRQELHSALHMVPTGESPSSSASDVDNLNNQSTGEKAASAKGVSSPQVAGNHVIMARHRPNFVRLLNFVQDVYFAMEASKRSHYAISSINAGSEELHYGPEIIASVRQILDLSFHDVEGLLRLVRLSMDAISR